MTITRATTDAEILKATKKELIDACFTGSFAVLRKHRMRTWTKAQAIEEAAMLRGLMFAKGVDRLPSRTY